MAKESRDLIKSFTYDQVVAEIGKIQDLLSKYSKGDPALPADFNYKSAIFTLRYLRLRQKSWKKQNNIEEPNE